MIGLIQRDPVLTLDEWVAHIRRDAQLEPTEPRVVDNPFEPGERTRVVPPPGGVTLHVDGELTGAIEPSPEFDRDAELHVYAPDHRVQECRRAVEAIARALSAKCVWFDDE